MTNVSIQQAAKIANVHRTTISRAIESGKLSIVTLDNGQRCIDPSELSRVFPTERPVVQGGNVQGVMLQSAPTAHAMVLEARMEELLRLVRTLESDKEDLRRRLDRAEQERGVALRLLEDQRHPRWSWWPWSRKAA